MSISSSDKFGGIIVNGTEILALCFPVKALINGSDPDSLLEAAKTKLVMNLFASKEIYYTFNSITLHDIFLGSFV